MKNEVSTQVSTQGLDAELLDITTTGGSSILMFDTTCAWRNYIEPYSPICETFICPNCGSTYLADSAGFIPNCHNCGSVMKHN